MVTILITEFRLLVTLLISTIEPPNIMNQQRVPCLFLCGLGA